VSVDLGTGDGRYVLAEAVAHPDRLVIGVDAGAAAMVEAARRAAGRPTRGGQHRVEKRGTTTEQHVRPDDELAIPILRVSDAERAATWYQRLGFAQESVHRFAPGMPAFVTIARRRMRLLLSEHEGDARPGTLVYLRVRDVEAIAAEFGVTVEQAPWAREIELSDPDGNRLWIGTPTG